MLVAVLPLADRLAVPLVALAPGAGEVNTVAVEAMLWRPLAKASVTMEAALAFEVSSLPSCHLPLVVPGLRVLSTQAAVLAWLPSLLDCELMQGPLRLWLGGRTWVGAK